MLFLSGGLVYRVVERITSFVITAGIYVYTSFLFIFEVFLSTFYRVNSLFHCFSFIFPFDVFFTVFSICIFILLASFRQLNLCLILNLDMKFAFYNLTLIQAFLKFNRSVPAGRFEFFLLRLNRIYLELGSLSF